MGINQRKCKKNLQARAEFKVGKKLGSGMRILNSYWVGQDGMYKWYEVILIDWMSRPVRNDPKLSWICGKAHKRRDARGVTSAARKSRGLRVKGHGAEKVRPSRQQSYRRRSTLKLRNKRPS